MMGGAPQEDEDCTVEQLSALNKRVVALDLPPYVDLAVWQPYGRRALKTTKFRAWIPDRHGAYMAKELPGPANYGQWLSSWRVFQTAAIMLDILPLATLQLYERHVEKLTKLYPAAWHLIAMADDKAHGDKWARLRLKITTDIAAGRPKTERWDDRRPWVGAMHQLVADGTFWEEQVRSPANAWMPRRPKEPGGELPGRARTDGDFSPNKRRTAKERRQAKKAKVQADKEELKKLRAPAASSSKGKGTGKDGNLKAKDQTATDLCFNWDSGKGPCASCAPGEQCKGKVKRAHKCRICLSPGHRSADCPQKA